MLDQVSTSTRQDVVSHVAQQLSAVVSKRVGIAVSLWGDPGIGKTHAVGTILERVPCRHLSLHATTSEAQIVTALPKVRMPAWVHAQIARLERGEPVEKSTFVATLAATLSALAPFVLHLEDVHEADAERLDLITALAHAVTRTRGVGLLVTSRAELPQPFRNHRLEPLRLAETAALLEYELKAKAPRDGLEWVFGRTQGNPLFTLEFLRYLLRQGFMWSDGNRWNWRAPPEDFMPITVDAMVSQLMLGVAGAPETRATLEARAILPGELQPEVLKAVWAEVAGLEPEALLVAMSILERGGVLHGDRFAHPLFAEITRRDLLVDQRAVYATRAMLAFEAIDPVLAANYVDDADLEPMAAVNRLERAARQLHEAGDPNRAAHLLGLAAERSTGEERVRLALKAEGWVHAQQQRARLSGLALEAQPQNREVRYRFASALAMMGKDDEVKALIVELPESERFETRWVETVFLAQAQSTRSFEALQTWRDHPELAQFPRSISHAAHAYVNLGDFQSAERLIFQALEMTNLSVSIRANIVGLLAFIRSEQGQLEEAQHLHDQGLALAQQGPDRANLAASQYNRSFNLYRLGHYQDAIKSLEEAIELYDQDGVYKFGANARTVLGMILARLGRFTEAETTILEGYDTFSRLGVTHGLANAEWELGLLYAEWRPPHGGVLALKFARDAVKHSRQLANARCLGGALPAAARVEAWAGNPTRALELAQEALDLSLSSLEDAYAFDVALATALEANGQTDAALLRWGDAIRRTQILEYQYGAELERARLMQDQQRALELLEWFKERGLGALVLRAQRYFPIQEPELILPRTAKARIEVLGAIRLSQNGQSIPTRARKRLEILTYLLETRIAGRTETSTLELVDALYPDMPEPEAKKALKQLVYLNRSSLGADSVISTPTGYALGAVSSDAEDFLQTGDPALWRGEYLGSLTEGWHQGVRDAMTLALQTKAESLLESDPNEAARLGLILTEMEPLDTQTLRLAVQSLERSGNLQSARATYREGRSRLLEMGEVLPETVDGFLRL